MRQKDWRNRPRSGPQKRRAARRAKIEASKVIGNPVRPGGSARLSLVSAPGVGLVLGTAAGRWSTGRTIVLKIPNEDLVGAVEAPEDLGALCAKTGMLALAALTNFPLAEGPEALARHLVRWAGVDLEALRAELEDAGPDGVPDALATADLPGAAAAGGGDPGVGAALVPATPSGGLRSEVLAAPPTDFDMTTDKDRYFESTAEYPHPSTPPRETP